MRFINNNVIWAYSVHLFTALGAFIGILALDLMVSKNWQYMFLVLSLAMFIDAVDGFFARTFDVKRLSPHIDGITLDNMVDFFTYALIPAFFIIYSGSFGEGVIPYIVSLLVVLSSCYQFTQKDAKTSDNFFKGFPSYWNIVIFYLFVFQWPALYNQLLVIFLCIMSFVPIKYIYPSRIGNLFRSAVYRYIFSFLTYAWAFIGLMMIISYPRISDWMIAYNIFYWVVYFGLSLFRTFYPLKDVEN